MTTLETRNPVRRNYRLMGRIVAAVLLLAALAVVYLAATHKWNFAAKPAQSGATIVSGIVPGQKRILYWYDPMHPAYTSDKPGIAPDCGMALVPKYAEEENASKKPQGSVTIGEDQQSLAGVRTAVVERTAIAREIRTTAQIVADESRFSHVHVKVPGFVDHVYVDYAGQQIHKGQPLFTFYSPDLVAAEEEYLIAKRGAASLSGAPYKEIAQGAHSLLDSSREKLRLWDITDEEIRQLDQSGKAIRNITVYAPASGFVVDRKVFMQAAVSPETELYTVSDLSSVWALVDVYESEVPYVRLGQRVTLSLSYYPGKSYSGAISFIYPNVDPQTRTVKARVQLANPGLVLKPQMFADATLHVDYGKQISVPRDAVLDSGTEKLVYVVKPGGSFEPRTVVAGPTVDDKIVILSGLNVGETIVVSGNFLVDSESRLKGASTQH